MEGGVGRQGGDFVFFQKVGNSEVRPPVDVSRGWKMGHQVGTCNGTDWAPEARDAESSLSRSRNADSGGCSDSRLSCSQGSVNMRFVQNCNTTELFMFLYLYHLFCKRVLTQVRVRRQRTQVRPQGHWVQREDFTQVNRHKTNDISPRHKSPDHKVT